MEPTIALMTIRNVLASIRGFDVNDVILDKLSDDIEYLAENFDALDDWLSKGGSLPATWDR